VTPEEVYEAGDPPLVIAAKRAGYDAIDCLPAAAAEVGSQSSRALKTRLRSRIDRHSTRALGRLRRNSVRAVAG
jgi:hypothetical protein